MSFDVSAWADMMPHRISIEEPDGTFTDQGEPNYGVAVSYPCSIQPSQGEHIIKGPGHEERVASWTIYVGTTTLINPDSRLTLPVGFNPLMPPFFAMRPQPDERGTHAVTLLV